MTRNRAETIEPQYKALVENLPDVVWSATAECKVLFVSPNVERVLGFSAAEITSAPVSFWVDRMHPDDVERVQHAFANIESDGYSVEYRWQRKDGEWIWIRSHAALRGQPDGVPVAEGTLSDITAHKTLEEQLSQSQKMEAIGRLTGGIAHDFNNILAVILGNSELLLETLPMGDPRRSEVEAVIEAGRRGAGLTRQLLAFSRRQVVEPRVLDLGEVVLGLERMLRRIIGEDIELSVKVARPLCRVKADVGQIEQVVLNLAVNARDAMPGGGVLSIEMGNVFLGERDASAKGLAAGDYVMLSVRDSGHGMDERTMRRVFEPFFTTKEKGQGTGLGLSTCYGIVKQSHGHISVDSWPGGGSLFRVYLPKTTRRQNDVPLPRLGRPGSGRGTETILVIEDSASFRSLVSQVLTRSGYRVLEASRGDEALTAWQTYPGVIDLVLSDVVVPGMNGPAIVSAIRESSQKSPRVLFMTGYSEHPALGSGAIDVIQKPFSPSELVGKVREALDAVLSHA